MYQMYSLGHLAKLNQISRNPANPPNTKSIHPSCHTFEVHPQVVNIHPDEREYDLDEGEDQHQGTSHNKSA